MNDKLQQALQTLIPFIVLGVAIALAIGLLVMFSYVFLWGLLIGAVLWIIAIAKQYLFTTPKMDKEQGRIIEHDDKK